MATFRVTLYITESHEYEVEANTPEEAETTAEDIFFQGEDGIVSSAGVEAWDTVVVE